MPIQFRFHHIILTVIIIVGVFLRIHDHSSVMHFELDQARDVFVVHDARETGKWPLYGPMASGSDLFLGPMFYHMQIIGSYFFGTSPESLAALDTLFGILLLPVGYLLLRRTFDPLISCATLSLAASSLYLITYARFAWNPNAMAFWSTLLIYLLSLLPELESRWARILAMTGIALSSATLMQLHFIGFLCVPLIIVGYFLIIRTASDLRLGLYGVCMFLLLMSPMIYQEIRSGGATSAALWETITDKGSQNDNHSFSEKTFRAAQKTATYFTATLISDNHGGAVLKTRRGAGPMILCDDKCKKRLPLLAVSAASLLLSFFAFARSLRDTPAEISALITLWSIAGGAFLILLAYQISPRFYLFFIPVILLLWAILLDYLEELIGSRWPIILVACLVSLNLFGVYKDYRVAKDSQDNAIDAPRDLMLARSDRVTLGSLRAAASVIAASEEVERFVITGDNRYARALYYLTHVEQSDDRPLCYAKRGGLPDDQYNTYPIWHLARTASDTQIPDAITATHTVQGQKKLGTLTLYKLTPNTSFTVNTENLPEKCFVR